MVAHASPVFPREREPYPHGETVTHRRLVASGDDGYGTPIKEWVSTDWEGVGFAPGGSVETLANGSTRVVSDATIYDPLCREAGAGDEFIVRGQKYYVDGESSGVWVNPITGWAGGSVVTLKAVSGG